MMLKIPYSIIPVTGLRKISRGFLSLAEFFSPFFPSLALQLKQAKIKVEARVYIGLCLTASALFFLFFGFFISLILFVGGVDEFLVGFFVAFFITLFIFLQQLMYPKLLANRRVKYIEKNLFAALENMLVQLNSGVPLFSILVNISKGNYGGVSEEFNKAVREINSGRSQIEVLEEIAALNPSIFFRRSIWQIVNGMKSGADMAHVTEEAISSITEAQVLQIQQYGSQLNPIAMFYMLAVVIIPSLGMTFLIILSSFIALGEGTIKTIFWSLYGAVVFFQMMFLGVIKAKRPNLLGD